MKCEAYIKGKARDIVLFDDIPITICNVKHCRYGFQILLGWEADYKEVCETNGEIHKKGLVRKIIGYEGIIKSD